MSHSQEPLSRFKPPSPPPWKEEEEEEEASEEEKEVAKILMELPELIKNCPRVSLIGKPPWLHKMKRSAMNVLKAPPPSPHSDHPMNEVMGGLTNDVHELIERKDVYIKELENISIHRDNQRAFNLLLKQTREASLPQGKNTETSSDASVKVQTGQNHVLRLGDEPSSSARAEAHDQISHDKISANGISESENFKNNKVSQSGDEPSSANGLELNQNQGLRIRGGDETSSARVEVDDEFQELLRTNETLEGPEAGQDQGLQCGNEQAETDQIEGPSSPSREKPDQDQGLQSGNEPSQTDQIEGPSSSTREKPDQDHGLQCGNEPSETDQIEGQSSSTREKSDQDQNDGSLVINLLQLQPNITPGHE